MINSKQIISVLKSNTTTRKYFIGVFARDELVLKPRWPCCFILNTHTRNKPGEHWLAFFYDSNGKCEFFDSYGLPPVVYHLEKYLENTSTSWSFNEKQIQGSNSSYCGYYCLFFLYFKCHNYSLDKICNFFSNNSEKNDEKIKNLIKSM